MYQSNATKMSELLVFFEGECRGVKFHQLLDVSASYGTLVTLWPKPTNEHDALCVVVFVLGAGVQRGFQMPLILGHIAREAARWICPLLCSSCLRDTRYYNNSYYNNCKFFFCINYIAMWYLSLTHEFQETGTGGTELWIFTFLWMVHSILFPSSRRTWAGDIVACTDWL